MIHRGVAGIFTRSIFLLRIGLVVGLIGGGSQVNLVVAFMPGIITEVRFGDGVAQCASLDLWMTECVLPPGNEGVVDITKNRKIFPEGSF